MFEKQKRSIDALVDVSESMLNAMEQHGVDPETVANKPEFSVLVHFLKSIIDGELNIPNELTDKIRSASEELGLDLGDTKKRLH
jgi:KaiC/GvpD/RAD55 family RecA-like ATPase|tara:strand:- start:33 stop:284 length:252 start_codon:yes stop_codon:yes gene_type:complete